MNKNEYPSIKETYAVVIRDYNRSIPGDWEMLFEAIKVGDVLQGFEAVMNIVNCNAVLSDEFGKPTGQEIHNIGEYKDFINCNVRNQFANMTEEDQAGRREIETIKEIVRPYKLTDGLVKYCLPWFWKTPERSKFERAAFYLQSYPHLLQLAQNNALKNEARLYQLACAAYGWMPTIPKKVDTKFSIEAAQDVSTAEQALKFIHDMDVILNNSWVGTSKILHFINPTHFPIWDSNVARAIHQADINANNKKTFLKYVEKIHRWNVEQPNYGDLLAAEVNNKLNYIPSNLRCFDMVLFAVGSNDDFFTMDHAIELKFEEDAWERIKHLLNTVR